LRGRPPSPFLAEQLDVQALGGHAGGADGHELVARAAAGAVDQPGDQFLARAGRAGDQHAAVGRATLAISWRRAWAGRRLAHQAVGAEALHPQAAVLALELGRFQGPVDHQQQAVGLERLFQELVGAALDGADGGLDVAVARDHDHRQVGVQLLDHVEQLQPVHAAALHPDVQDQQRGLAGPQGPQRLVGIGGHPHRVALILQDAGHQFADIDLVVDHKHVSAHIISSTPFWALAAGAARSWGTSG
jgi:hypothetical protein